MKKFELTAESKINIYGKRLFRIKIADLMEKHFAEEKESGERYERS